MMLKRFLRRDERGIGAVEFALVAPVLISFVIGISQVGRLFFANADMKNAMAAGARVASVWPVPEDDEILAAVNARLARTGADARSTPTIFRGTDANGNPYIEVRMTYTVPLEFVFFDLGPVTLTDTRRVFTQVTNANETEITASTSAGSSSTTGSTTTGGTTTTTTGGTTGSTTTGGTSGSTTTGGATTSTSATSASSTGGTTSSTSATSASSTSTTSSSGNASSGNASSGNGSSGHGHGDCKKKC